MEIDELTPEALFNIRHDLGCAVISSILQSPSIAVPLAEEFDLGKADFDSFLLCNLFYCAKALHLIGPDIYIGKEYRKKLEELRDFVPSGDNARYYIEELYEVRRKKAEVVENPFG